MAKRPARSTYVRLVGEISIQWTYMERALHAIGFSYLGGDVGVAGHIFAGMNNAELCKFVGYLCERFEKNRDLKKHVKHFIQGFSILRESRNVLQHAVPALSRDRRYVGKLRKSDRKGILMTFDASINELKDVLEDLEAFLSYGRVIQVVIEFQKKDDGKRHMGGPTRAESSVYALEKMGKSAPPRKLNPAPPR